MSVWRRVLIGAAVVGGFTIIGPGVASAHVLGLTANGVCVDGGGWRATAVLTPSEPGPNISGTMTSTPPGVVPSTWSLAPNQSQTFTTPIFSTSVGSVGFAAQGTWTDGVSASATASAIQPTGCTPVTTTSTSTTTTTSTTTSTTTTTLPPTTTTTTTLPPTTTTTTTLPPTTTTTTTLPPTTTTTTTLPPTTTTTTTLPPTTTTTTTLPPTTTTTTTLPPTTTTLPSTLTISAITPLCQSDAPYIEVTFGNQPEFNGHTATITFIDVNGVVVATHTATYQANTSVRFIYPGASVDAAGNATDWPGWRFDGDEWVLDPTDAYLRDGMTVRVEVNPVATGQVAYPPPDSGCANPVNPPGGGGTPALPVTGGAAGPTAAVAAGAVALGGLALLLARRRPGRAA